MPFFMMYMQTWSTIVHTWVQMMNPYAYLPKGLPSGKVSITAEVRELEDRDEMRRALKEYRRMVDDIWPEDVIKGDK